MGASLVYRKMQRYAGTIMVVLSVIVAVMAISGATKDTDHIYIEDVDEQQKIDSALVQSGYFREGIDLTFEEQDILHTECEIAGVDYDFALRFVLSSGLRNADEIRYAVALMAAKG